MKLAGRLIFLMPMRADAACQLLDDPETRVRLGHAARQLAQQNYDLSTICLPKQLDWVNRLLDK